MNFLEMQSLAKSLSGDTYDVEFDKMIQFLNEGQRFIASELGGLYKIVTFGTLDNYSGNFGGVLLPDDFDRVMHVTMGSKRLQPGRYTDVYSEDGGDVLSVSSDRYSTHYFLMPYAYIDEENRGRRLEFYPPRAAGSTVPTVAVHYIANVTDMVNNTDVCSLPTTLHRCVVMYALYMGKIQQNDFAAAKFIMDNDIRPTLATAIATLNDTGNYNSYGEVREIATTFTESLYD